MAGNPTASPPSSLRQPTPPCITLPASATYPARFTFTPSAYYYLCPTYLPLPSVGWAGGRAVRRRHGAATGALRMRRYTDVNRAPSLRPLPHSHPAPALCAWAWKILEKKRNCLFLHSAFWPLTTHTALHASVLPAGQPHLSPAARNGAEENCAAAERV